jgi:hypothetical protein
MSVSGINVKRTWLLCQGLLITSFAKFLHRGKGCMFDFTRNEILAQGVRWKSTEKATMSKGEKAFAKVLVWPTAMTRPSLSGLWIASR